MTEKQAEERDTRLTELERQVQEELRPAHDEAIVKVDNALSHLRAATADLDEVRRIENLAGSAPR